MMGSLARVLAGFLLASLTAGLVQVLYVMTPAALLGSPSDVIATRFGETGLLALLAATHAAIFAAAFTMIAAVIGEWLAIRSPVYYLFAGAIIGLLGFFAQYASEVAGQPTIFNNYALKAYLTSGFFAGLVYWFAAGCKAGGPRRDAEFAGAPDATTIGVPPPSKTWKTRPRIIVDDQSKPGSQAARLAKKSTLTERLADPLGKALGKKSEAAAPQSETKPAAKPETKPAPAAPASDKSESTVTVTKTASDRPANAQPSADSAKKN